MTLIYLIVSALGGGGIATAIITQWGKVKIKHIDVYVDERKQFIHEVAELRNQMNSLYNQHYKLLEENEELKRKVKDLEDHVNKKSILLKELTSYRLKNEKLDELVNEYARHLNEEKFISSVIKLSKEDVPGN